MPRLPISEQALRLALTRPATSAASRQSQYVCRACVRQYHPSPAFRAELPFWKRMTNTLFGSSEQKAATEAREEATQKRLNELAEQGEAKTETIVDDQGREWTIAAIVDPTINKQYVQAQRWDGLEWVGSKEWVARQNDAGEAYVGFNPRRKLQLEAAEWRRVLHHVTVEVLALAQAGRDVNAVYTERAVNEKDWMRTARVQVRETGGAIELLVPEKESMDEILKAMPQSLGEEILKAAENVEAEVKAEDAEAELEESSMEPVEESVQQHADPKEIDAAEKVTMKAIKTAVKKSVANIDSGWLAVPLSDPTVKLAILKRVQQLTGHRVRDHAISNATSMSDIYLALKIKPEPKRLAATKQLEALNVDLPNVTVHQYRQTPIHKHKEVGRWKVIEDELIARGLPVTGSRWQGAKTSSPML